ncbi:hypothetical protein DDB_G0267542 [Dictyostelium discoideum AX4]|uniref:Uncharacterized protein DDB_G0267542 n=1 Tax=Dictyostelium discoideum TaxID=44689 RepID=Y9358_DICDI|nr:hypothetical protein DDB_G0267542 [Dictyostelium discoideum AX4]Q55GS1.1 RecName: Full=Uncharacterized protein DDB_G0267542 [Dictyostelium discoideum]EAL73224.1 hypothetical protein DDB_G0267542 [Dictyostelium discoideum AX4]|eukprot:XP_647113.1 hypothetical protein DDB_G0267542 [Dictyostelium discoideum AX4]
MNDNNDNNNNNKNIDNVDDDNDDNDKGKYKGNEFSILEKSLNKLLNNVETFKNYNNQMIESNNKTVDFVHSRFNK